MEAIHEGHLSGGDGNGRAVVTLIDVLVEPLYPRKSNGRLPMALSTMLQIYFMQQWFDYSERTMEEALNDIPLLRQFAGLGAFEDTLPDKITILPFRHLLEQYELAFTLFSDVSVLLAEKGLKMKWSSVVVAMPIAAPSTIKSQDKRRDLEMSLSKKGNQWVSLGQLGMFL